MPRVLLLLMLVAVAFAARSQESVVTGISEDNIALTANFSGSDLFVFGAIRRDGPAPDDSELDVIITIKGPPAPVTIRRKERRFGIWVNTESVTVRAAPTFYAIATTRPLDDLLTETERLRYGIGMDQAVRRVGGHETLTDTSDFTEALVRIRNRQRLYEQFDGGVSLAQDTLFQTEIAMPANITEGDYAAEFFLVRDRRVVSMGTTTILVRKAGLERWVYNLSQNQPLLYGVLSVLLALAAGWLAASIFRLIKR